MRSVPRRRCIPRSRSDQKFLLSFGSSLMFPMEKTEACSRSMYACWATARRVRAVGEGHVKRGAGCSLDVGHGKAVAGNSGAETGGLGCFRKAHGAVLRTASG